MGGGSRDFDWSKDSYRDRDRSRDSDRQRNYRSYSSVRRSSDYRSEDSHLKNDEYGERKYRNQSDHRRQDYRDRERRTRSRSRSCERDGRNYDSDRSKNSDRYEDRDRDRPPLKEKKETPNNTLMIRNLPMNFTDKDLSSVINRYGLFPKDVRLMKNKETGQSRGFAFIEFPTVEQAVQLKEMTEGCILIDEETECTLHFSFPKDGSTVDKNGIKNDWSCPKCGINNFKRRDECFKCGTSKDDVRTFEPNEVIQQPTNVLLLRNLTPTTTEERVLTIIGTLTTMPIKSIRIAQDSYSQKGVCTLELHSVYEATQLFTIISSMTNGFVIDDSIVSLSYGQRTENFSSSTSSVASQNAAMAALAAAQWKNLDDSKSKTAKASSLGTITINSIEYTKYTNPDYSSFQFDSTSGYYYDTSTGYYYDSNSQYFYNSQTQKYMYYDTTNQIYVSVDSTGQTDNSTPSSVSNKSDSAKKTDENVNKQDKVKIAKKIAKDMEKWAKTLNQKKENSKPLSQNESLPTEINESSADDLMVDTLLERPSTSFELLTSNIERVSIDPFEIIRAEEERLTDWKKIACLLCKRQFNSVELLTKHQQLSELHKTNLTVVRQSILNEEQLQHVENVEKELGYRDRAKERRDKFGIDDTPEIANKPKFEEPQASESSSAPALPISGDNIGNRMLKAMGWTEGTGLGKSNQGKADIIQVERRRSGLGLGSNNAAATPFTKESYKDAVRRTALQRFKEMNEN